MDMNALMAPSGATTPTRDGELLSLLRQQLTQGQAGLSLEQRLARLTPEQRQQLLMFARFAQSMAAAEVAMKGYSSQSYAAIVKGLYRGNPEIQKLIVDVLEDVAPIEVHDEPKPSSVSPISLYDRPEFKLPVSETAVNTMDTEPTLKPEPEQASLFTREALPDGPDAFVKRIAPMAKAVAAELGIDPRIVVAQAALETGWGKSVKGNNLLGVKSHGKANGLMVATHEVIDGRRIKIKDSFRQYENFDDSIADYGSFLRENKQYKPLLDANTLEEQITALGKSGYATDPSYADKVKQIAISKRLEGL